MKFRPVCVGALRSRSPSSDSRRTSAVRLILIGIAEISLFLAVAVAGAQQIAFSQAAQNQGRQNESPRPLAQPSNNNSAPLEILHVQGNVSMLAGAGGNITVQTG